MAIRNVFTFLLAALTSPAVCATPTSAIAGAAAQLPKITVLYEAFLIAGGFHLVAAPDEVIAQAVTLLHDTAKVDYIAPGHCTGEPTFTALRQAFGDRYLYAGLGTVIGLGAQPRSQ